MRPFPGNQLANASRVPQFPSQLPTANLSDVPAFRIGDAAELLGVSTDTVRRWVDGGRLAAARDEHGHRVIHGVDLAAFVRSGAPEERSELSSARNRLR